MAGKAAEKITADTTVSTSELAVVLGLTGRRIQQLVQDGTLVTVERGRLPLADAVQRYIKFLSAGTVDKDDIEVEKARRKSEAVIKASRAAVAKMEVAELQGKMHRSEDVAAMTEDMIYNIRSMLLALPGRLAVDTSAAESAAEAAVIIRREVYAVMNELSHYQYDPQKYEERVRNRRNWDASNGRGDDDE